RQGKGFVGWAESSRPTTTLEGLGGPRCARPTLRLCLSCVFFPCLSVCSVVPLFVSTGELRCVDEEARRRLCALALVRRPGRSLPSASPKRRPARPHGRAFPPERSP